MYRERAYYVYIVVNKNHNVMYIGVTNNLERRILEHKSRKIKGFSKRYNTHKLVYYEETDDITLAIEREKQLKGWIRDKKNALVTSKNPKWDEIVVSYE